MDNMEDNFKDNLKDNYEKNWKDNLEKKLKHILERDYKDNFNDMSYDALMYNLKVISKCNVQASLKDNQTNNFKDFKGNSEDNLRNYTTNKAK